MLTRLSDLRLREVINLADGQRLGFIDDVELEIEEGRITAVIIPIRSRLWKALFREEDLVIPWEKVHMIGTDVILVDLAGTARVQRK